MRQFITVKTVTKKLDFGAIGIKTIVHDSLMDRFTYGGKKATNLLE